MANMSTSLVTFSENGNKRTSAAPSNTAALPRLILQQRSIASGVEGVSEMQHRVVFGAADASGLPIVQRISFLVLARIPILARSTEVDAAKALYREMIASDNWAASVAGQLWL